MIRGFLWILGSCTWNAFVSCFVVTHLTFASVLARSTLDSIKIAHPTKEETYSQARIPVNIKLCVLFFSLLEASAMVYAKIHMELGVLSRLALHYQFSVMVSDDAVAHR